jgi:hypothetical protein
VSSPGRTTFALVLAAVLVNLPLVHGLLTGQRLGQLVVVVLVVDALLLGVAVLLWRFAGPQDEPGP